MCVPFFLSGPALHHFVAVLTVSGVGFGAPGIPLGSTPQLDLLPSKSVCLGWGEQLASVMCALFKEKSLGTEVDRKPSLHPCAHAGGGSVS
jgi:hypothetical protein